MKDGWGFTTTANPGAALATAVRSRSTSSGTTRLMCVGVAGQRREGRAEEGGEKRVVRGEMKEERRAER